MWDDRFDRRRAIDPGGGGGPGAEEPGGGGEEGGPPPEPEEPWEPPGGEGSPPEGGPPPEPEEPGGVPEGTTPIGQPGGGGDDGDGGAGGGGGTPTVQVRIYEWRTAQDARVCPICGPLDGGRWEDDDGPFPPAHMGCRCARVLVAVETRTVSRRVPLGGGDDGARRRWR